MHITKIFLNQELLAFILLTMDDSQETAADSMLRQSNVVNNMYFSECIRLAGTLTIKLGIFIAFEKVLKLLILAVKYTRGSFKCQKRAEITGIKWHIMLTRI